MFLECVLALCKDRNISKNKLLMDLNLNKSAFVNWGNRGNIPSGEIVAKIADYFQVSTDYLLGRTDDPRPAGEAAEPSPLRSTLLNNFEQLNQEGQERLVDTSDDVESQGGFIVFLERVLELIESRGITRNKLLKDIGLNTNSFVAWENRGTVPGGNTLSKLADYFQVSTDYLLGRTDDPRPAGEAAEPSPLRSTLLNNFEQLNQEGQEKLVDTSDDMVSSGKYKKVGAFSMGTKEA